MTTYKSCKKLTKTQAAYIAGLIDGEGTVTLTRKHRNEQRQLAVTVSSTEREILEFVLESTNVGKITGKRTYKDHHLPSFTYAVHNRQALALLEQVSPLMISYKKARAGFVLKHYIDVTPRNGKYNVEMLEVRKEFEEAFFKINPK